MIEKMDYYGKRVGIVAGALLVIAAGVSVYRWVTKPPVDTTVAVVAEPAVAIKNLKQVNTAVKTVRTFVPSAKAKLKLPDAVIANEQQQVTGAATVKPSERPVTVTSVINTETGETSTFAKVEPYPWLAIESRKEIRLSYGYKMQRNVPTPTLVGRLSASYDFVQVKGLHVGATGALDTDGGAFAGIGVGYRW